MRKVLYIKQPKNQGQADLLRAFIRIQTSSFQHHISSCHNRVTHQPDIMKFFVLTLVVLCVGTALSSPSVRVGSDAAQAESSDHLELRERTICKAFGVKCSRLSSVKCCAGLVCAGPFTRKTCRPEDCKQGGEKCRRSDQCCGDLNCLNTSGLRGRCG